MPRVQERPTAEGRSVNIIPNMVRRHGSDLTLDVPLAIWVQAGDADRVCVAEGTLPGGGKSVPLALAEAFEELAAVLREQADS